jgi:uncharacterized membrane protein YidH (DUF202 family)
LQPYSSARSIKEGTDKPKNAVMNEKNQTDMTKPDVDTAFYLAVTRTELSLERTQLAWIRTIMALMGTGIAISKGLEALQKARIVSGVALIRHGNLSAIVLTIAGTILLIAITVIFISRGKQLAFMKQQSYRLINPAFLVSMVTIFLGTAIGYLLITY